ncbi:MAG TPA: DinB family protein [Terriglobales bacterium]|nr:DinB family protein [Terriglobales bacterium]
MHRMKSFALSLLVFFWATSSWGQTKPPGHPTLSEIMDHAVGQVEGEFVSAAEAMPEEKYSFAPTNGEFKGVRTFAEQVKHVAAVNYIIAAAVLEEKPPVELGGENGPSSMTTKADIVKFAKDSFAYAHKAMRSINEQNQIDQIKSPFGQGTVSRIGIATVALAHPFDHYGQMAVYLRMNGIIPPASRQ